MMQRTANENAACERRICKRSDQPKMESNKQYHCIIVCYSPFLADQIFYRSCVHRQHFRLRSFRHHHVSLSSILGAVGLFRFDMLLIFNMVWP